MFKKSLNLIVFIALMGTSALALASQLLFSAKIFHWLAFLLEVSVIIIFLYYFILLLEHIYNWNNFIDNIKNPAKTNLYSAMPIASALITLMLVNIGLPLFSVYSLKLAILFWLISLFFSLFFVVIIPINLKFRSQIQHIAGTWFLPPVGLFVLITAGSVLALKVSSLQNFIKIFNLFLLGPAFILYFLTLNLIYYKSKIQQDIENKMIPTFHIVLAPVAVSILALLSLSQLLKISPFSFNIRTLFFQISILYSFLFYGYGLWVIGGLLTLYYRIIKEKTHIPLSELWWAFVFPTGAFTLATFQFYKISHLFFLEWFSYIFYFVLFFLWLYIFNFSFKNYKKNES